MIGNIFDLAMSFYMILIPVIVNSLKNQRETLDYLFQSEVFAIIMFLDSYMVRRLSSKKNLSFYEFVD